MNTWRWLEHIRAPWPWLPLWLLIALLAIFSHGPMPFYSTRTLAVAWEMWNHHQWLVPHLNGEPYSAKTPLLFWLFHGGWFVSGVSDIWPRLLEVAFGGTVLVLLTILARSMFPEQPWVSKAAPWMWLGLSYPFFFGLQIMYDQLLTVWVLAALICLVPKPRGQKPRWILFGLYIGGGLLTKGPVMLLHVFFPWLLGPLWNDWAHLYPTRWYGLGLVAMLLGCLMLLAWALPASLLGGQAYQQRLFFTQTMARIMVEEAPKTHLQAHARPFFWYLLMLPVILFPFIFWPRAWWALTRLRRPLSSGLRFALCWVVPSFVAFSWIGGKQLYYLLPELAGGILLLAGALAMLRENHPTLAHQAWLGPWPIGIMGIALGISAFALPTLVTWHVLDNPWLIDIAAESRLFGALFIVPGLLLLRPGRWEIQRLALVGLTSTLALNTLFTLTLWYRYDLGPITRLLADTHARHRAIGYVGHYYGEFHFAAHLTQPITILPDTSAILTFAHAHPEGLIITHARTLSPQVLRHALLAQPFRSSWHVVWLAGTLADLRQGIIPTESMHPPIIHRRRGRRNRAWP